MNLALFIALSAALCVAACGTESNTNVSQLNEITAPVRPQGEPDFKTKDGVQIMTWVKRSDVRKAICGTLREVRNQGFSASSPEAFTRVAQAFELHPVEAEVVAVYVLEMECPELN
ncbi:MAG: hypothetical protein FJY29_13105 [Betaproteobacteria bacterium]|nr:hypothetical protein [Betaproteobacteria bacterium]